jgi:Asp-tRNA(Asn)/Glu-tRNA(Gln) amidotransferase C subunit
MIASKAKVEDEDESNDGLEIEAETILDYIENFNDLFENGKIIEAAYYAAASPKNVLRDIETLYRFKS